MKISPYKFISAAVLWTYVSWLPVFNFNMNPVIAYVSMPAKIGMLLEPYIPIRASYLTIAFLISLIFCIGISLSLYKIITLFLVEQKHFSKRGE